MNNGHYQNRTLHSNNKQQPDILIQDYETESNHYNYPQTYHTNNKATPIKATQNSSQEKIEEEEEEVNQYYTTYEGHPEYVAPLKSPELKQYEQHPKDKHLNLQLHSTNQISEFVTPKKGLALKSSRERTAQHSFLSQQQQQQHNQSLQSHQFQEQSSINQNHFSSMRSTLRGSKMGGDDKLRYSTVDISMVKSDEQEQMGSLKNLAGYKTERRNDPITSCALI